MQGQNTSKTPTDTQVMVNPLAVLVTGHVAASLMKDPTAPILLDARSARMAGDVDKLDARCPGGCDSETMVSIEPELVIVTVGHAPFCAWWYAVLADAMARDGDGITTFARSLAVTGAPA